MKKHLIKICPVFLAISIVFSACGTDKTITSSESTGKTNITKATEDPTKVIVAEFNGVPIYKDDYDLYYERAKKRSEKNNIVLTEEELKGKVFDDITESMIQQFKLEELGYIDKVKESNAHIEYAQRSIDNMLRVFYLDLNYTQADLEAARESYQDVVLKKYFSTASSFEQLAENCMLKAAIEMAKKEIIGEIVPTDEQIKKYYDECVEKYKKQFDEDPSAYVRIVLDGFDLISKIDFLLEVKELVYVPAGVRRVRQVLIPLDQKAQAEDILSRLQSGEISFDDALEEYPDKDMPIRGYPIFEGDNSYSPEFAEAALGLENIGDITGLVETDFGYSIIQYYSDEPEGSVPLDRIESTNLLEKLKIELTEEAWLAVMRGWRDEGLIIFEENLN